MMTQSGLIFPGTAPASQRGISLIELMVGMVVALVTVLAITQVMVASEAYKRATAGGSDAQQNGAYSELMLERYIRMAGSNFATIPNALGCPLNAYNTGTLVIGSSATTNNGVTTTSLASAAYPEPFKTTIDFAPLLSPVIVKQGASGAADTLIVFSGQHPSIAKALSPTVIGSGSLGTVAFVSSVGVNEARDSANAVQRDLLLAIDQDSAAGSATCDVAEAMALTTTTTTVGNVTTSYSTVALTGTGNRYTGSNAFNAYTKSSLVADLGPAPQFLAFGVGSDGSTSDALLVYDMLGGSLQSLADGIVTIKALYGVASSPTDPLVSSWVAPSGSWAPANLTATSIQRIRALRLAVVARNAHREKPGASQSGGSQTRVSPATLTLFADSSASITYTVPDQNYRYKVFDVTIPLRQMMNMTRN